MKYWLTVSVPVEAASPADARDLGFEKIIDPEGPPEGLKEHVSDGEPHVISPNLLDPLEPMASEVMQASTDPGLVEGTQN